MNKAKNVLLIEDGPHDQFFFIQALKEIPNAALCDVAINGREALSKLENCATLPDLIFTDIHMPVMDGIEFLSEMIKSSRIKDIPVVVLSSDSGHIEMVRKLGARAFIKKTCDFGLLQKELEQMINEDFEDELDPQPFQTMLSPF